MASARGGAAFAAGGYDEAVVAEDHHQRARGEALHVGAEGARGLVREVVEARGFAAVGGLRQARLDYVELEQLAVPGFDTTQGRRHATARDRNLGVDDARELA